MFLQLLSCDLALDSEGAVCNPPISPNLQVLADLQSICT